MEKNIILNNQQTPYWLDDTGRIRNERTGTWYKGATNKGYHLVNLYFKGKQYTLYIHRLVAEYFLDNPNTFSIVHHKDGNKLNNCVWNLEWVSESEHNNLHAAFCAPVSNHHIKIQDEEIVLEDLRQFRQSPYYVSSKGEVYNLSKKIKMRPQPNGKYYRVQCYYNLKGKRFMVHRMVWEAFNGEIPDDMEINHINGNPSDNSIDNLELVSHQENCVKANHNNIKIYSVNAQTQERIDYSSINQAALITLGYKDGVIIPRVIKNKELFYDCYWYYKE